MDLNILSQIIIASIAATTVMTLFSYAVSAGARQLYKEPVLLTFILSALGIEVSPKVKIILGWLLHYLIGLAFVVLYHYVWLYDILELSWSSAFILGAISGAIGIFGWMIMFKASSNKPNIDFKGYYIQLFIAHVIFTLVAFIVYRQLINY